MKEITEPINMPTGCICKGDKVIRKSDCCHAPVVNNIDGITLRIPVCHYCGNQCHKITSPCPNCNDQTEQIANG